MSEFLTADDFKKPPKATPTTLLGKKAWLRVISYDDQTKLAAFKGSGSDMAKMCLVMCLVNKEGEKIFPNVRDGMKASEM